MTIHHCQQYNVFVELALMYDNQIGNTAASFIVVLFHQHWRKRVQFVTHSQNHKLVIGEVFFFQFNVQIHVVF